MLTHSQTKFLLLASHSKNNPDNPFSNMPKEVIRNIKYLPNPDPDFLDALKETTDGQLKELRDRLQKAKSDPVKLKSLLLQAGDVTTPGGLEVRGTTLLECAIGSGDPEIVALIKPYFLEFEEGVEEREIQLERYRHCIEEIDTQKPDDLTWLIDIIKASSLEDVRAELATGDNYNYDPNYKEGNSPLRNALNKFRQEKLDPKHRIIDKPRMHCNYQNLIHAYEILHAEWNKLIVNDSYNKHYLISLQIIGLIQLLELPAYERYVSARGQIDDAIAGKEIERSLACLYGSNGSFPNVDINLINGRTGVGFNSYISIYGAGRCARIDRAASHSSTLQNLCQTKTSSLQNLCSALERKHPRV